MQGAANPTDVSDLLERVSLSYVDLGLETDLRGYEKEIRAALSQSELEVAVGFAQSDRVIECVRRLARIEADLSTDNEKGLGRVSTGGFPRLGGALHKEARRLELAPDALQYAVERTIHAGYLAMMLGSKVGTWPRVELTAEEMWLGWIPITYNVAPQAAAFAM